MQKLVNCIELILVEADLVSTIVNRRVRVCQQDDLVSCGWRVCLNAMLLVKDLLQLPVFFRPFSHVFFHFSMNFQFILFLCHYDAR